MATLTRKPTAERREEIVQAVLRIIGQQGLTSLTTATLAKEVGVSTGAIFRHFNSMDAVLQEVVEYALARVEETFPDKSLPAIERIMQLAHNRIRLLGDDAGLAWLLRSEQAYLTLPFDSVAKLRALVRRSKRFMLEAVREGATQGNIRADIEPEALLITIMGTVHALIGMPGAHKTSRTRSPKANDVLAGLLTMLAPDKRLED